MNTKKSRKFLKLQISSILGELIGVIVDEVKEVGYHDYKWNTANYASGIYIYTIEAKSITGKNHYNSVKKMLLVKVVFRKS
jgi:hypothetical protein